MDNFEAQPCQPEDWAEALRILFAHLERREREQHVSRMLDGRVDLSGLLGCYEQGRLIGAMLSIESPGRLLVIWPPRFRTSAPDQVRAIASKLALAARRFAWSRNVRLAQALLEPDDLPLEPAFQAAGFIRLSKLFYLEHRIAAADPPVIDSCLEFVHYNEALHDVLAELVEETFDGSQDCPEVNGVRAAEEMLAGHRAQGEFDPDRWLLVRQDGAWAGCLLLTGFSDVQALEITYLGVSPPHRGRGIGQQLVRKAISIAQAARFPTVTLAVDSRNGPALRIYKKEGFEVWDERFAYLLILEEEQPAMNADKRR